MILEAATALAEPAPGFLEGLRRLADEDGFVLIFDEMITGMRWSAGGAQDVYGVVPDLSTWGKALGNGFPVSALAGRRDILEYGGLNTDASRVFLLSTTHGPEVMSLAAYLAVVQAYAERDIVAVMERQGAKLAEAVNRVSRAAGLQDHVSAQGRPSCLVFTTHDHEGRPSQSFRTLFMQELLDRGVLAQSLVISAAHTDDDLDADGRRGDRGTGRLRPGDRGSHDRRLAARPTGCTGAARSSPRPDGLIRDHRLTARGPRRRSWDRLCTSGWSSSTPSAAASPATAYGRPWD